MIRYGKTQGSECSVKLVSKPACFVTGTDDVIPRANMGPYGGTVEAGRAYFGNRRCETIIADDINGECVVDFKDSCMMSIHWRENGMGSRYINDEKVVGTLVLILVFIQA
jgi:hypothetical protein